MAKLFQNPFAAKHAQQGMSLVTALIAVAIVGILAVFMNQIFSTADRSRKSVEIDSERENLRIMIRSKIDCI